jgi:peptide/nickel transport system permease protein
VLAWKQLDFVALARMAGCSSLRIIMSHLLPNVGNSVMVLSTLQIGWAIVVEASLSFLGVGIPPPAPTWGGMVAEGRKYVDTLWWVSVWPGIAIMLVVLSFNAVRCPRQPTHPQVAAFIHAVRWHLPGAQRKPQSCASLPPAI